MGESYGRPVNFIDLLTLMLIYLKLTGQIEYPWWLVLCPVWIGLIVSTVLFVIAIIIQGIYVDFEE